MAQALNNLRACASIGFGDRRDTRGNTVDNKSLRVSTSISATGESGGWFRSQAPNWHSNLLEYFSHLKQYKLESKSLYG
jgi:hypothetical protein